MLRFEPIIAAGCGQLAGPLSVLHGACFPEDPWDRRALADVLRMPGCFGQIAWADVQPVGFALSLALGAECEILALGVVRDRRRAGIGARLLDLMCNEAQRRGARGVVLEVAAENAAARALYRCRGFVQVGRRAGYYRRAGPPADALVLRLGLPEPPPST